MKGSGLAAMSFGYVPGESYVLTQWFTTALEGDNLAARLTVAWAEPAVLEPAGLVTATYQVTAPGAASSAARPLGTTVTVPDAPANLTPADVASWGPGAEWVLEVTVTFAGPDVLVTPVPGDPPHVTAPAPVTDLGQIVLRLDQVRDGEGFTS